MVGAVGGTVGALLAVGSAVGENDGGRLGGCVCPASVGRPVVGEAVGRLLGAADVGVAVGARDVGHVVVIR